MPCFHRLQPSLYRILGELVTPLTAVTQELITRRAAARCSTFTQHALLPLAAAASSTARTLTSNTSNQDLQQREQWAALLGATGHTTVNPCNSRLHPIVVHGVSEPAGDELSVQEAYTPESRCWGCGPAHPEGLHLHSRRASPDGLEAQVTIDAKYTAFPGIVNGGVLTTLLDCHGNWTAAVALMDRACLPRPPLTLTSSMHVEYKEPTPPGVPLLLRSRVVALKEISQPGVGRASVEVETRIFLLPEAGSGSAAGADSDPPGKLLVVARGFHKRLGALRVL